VTWPAAQLPDPDDAGGATCGATVDGEATGAAAAVVAAAGAGCVARVVGAATAAVAVFGDSAKVPALPVELGVDGATATPLPVPAPAEQPAGAFKGKFNGESVVAYLPGFGKLRLKFSVVAHPPDTLPILAVNICGRVLRVSCVPCEPVMVAGKQFMYISRLPILLNQVQAIIALPLGASAGIV